MIKAKSYIAVTLAVAAVISVFLVLYKRSDLIAGVFAGAALGMINYLVLQVSVMSIFAQPPQGVPRSYYVRQAALYFLRFFGKLCVLAVLLFVFVKVLHLHWLGLLIGLFLSMFIYVNQILRQKRKNDHSA